VNLIGEHTDYAQLPVLPMAIDRSLILTATADDSNAVSATSELFPEAGSIERDGAASQHGWLRYVTGALRELVDVAPGKGAVIRVEGDLPASGGLSSSSALTVGLIAALNEVWSAGFDREEVARRATLAERHVGVETGGMDQQVVAFGEVGHALRIDFLPPARRRVALPEGLAFVVAHSGEDALKGGAARDAYNERVVGARIAAVLLADQVGVDLDMPYTLGQVAGIDVVDVLVADLPEKVDAHTVAHGVDVNVARIVQLSHTTLDTRAQVPVRRVARHILSEAQRVDAAQEALEAGDLAAFGKLLNESHESLRQDMRCSTPALDRVCAAMRRAGALGARLTGAGFGGYALAACEPDAVERVVEAAKAATGGPAFEVRASARCEVL
jgi:galactokinase